MAKATHYQVVQCGPNDTEYRPMTDEEGNVVAPAATFRLATRGMRTVARACRDAGSRVRVTERQIFSPDGEFERSFRIQPVEVEVPDEAPDAGQEQREAAKAEKLKQREEAQAAKQKEREEKAATKAKERDDKREQRAQERIARQQAAQAAREAVQNAAKEPAAE